MKKWQIIGSGRVVDGSHDNIAIVRSATISQKYKIITFTFHREITEQTISVFLDIDTDGVKRTVKFNITHCTCEKFPWIFLEFSTNFYGMKIIFCFWKDDAIKFDLNLCWGVFMQWFVVAVPHENTSLRFCRKNKDEPKMHLDTTLFYCHQNILIFHKQHEIFFAFITVNHHVNFLQLPQRPQTPLSRTQKQTRVILTHNKYHIVQKLLLKRQKMKHLRWLNLRLRDWQLSQSHRNWRSEKKCHLQRYFLGWEMTKFWHRKNLFCENLKK